MGVPAFFRWLTRKYPSVIVHCNEEKAKCVNGVSIPIDANQPNPNGQEFDNLYLDMNGIIHPCTHPEDKPAPRDEDEMMLAIFECIDRLFNIVRPRKLLYMAIDGVAPRAKMNQQRSRRFRASKESDEKIKEMGNRREELLTKGAYLPPEKPKEALFDSNCITPGTPFMARLSACLHFYIHDRLTNNPAWKGVKVILSDANVPGEGEHKIMDFIRKQRAQADYDPNTQHVLCGADADLIMLGLATHEPNFTIIREELRMNKPRPCDLCSQVGHDMKDCVGCPKPTPGGNQLLEKPSFGEEVPFIFVRLCVLREYLAIDLQMPNLPFEYDFERALDDWVFMCFFVGNDFLPHLPSLEIREGAIDRLVGLYKECVYKTGGFVTNSGIVDLNRVQLILSELGKSEDEIFKVRQETELFYQRREKNRKRMALQSDTGRPSFDIGGQYAPSPISSGSTPIVNARQEAYKGRVQAMHTDSRKRKLEDEGEDEKEEEKNDEVRLWEDGFKDRYYESKFDVNKNNLEYRIRLGHEYVRGLCWVLQYYYQGCVSWKWYFPYHYAPFASDFVSVGELDMSFEKDTKPFQPLQQLMSVFPAASSSHVPKPWARLMHDPQSTIIDFYPLDFKIDLNGKKFAWQGVALLPFVDENRLFKALHSLYDDLTPEEKKRNVRGDDRIYVASKSSSFSFLKALNKEGVKEADFADDNIRGKVLLSDDCVPEGHELASPVRGLPSLIENQVICFRFRDPVYPDGFIFPAKRLKGAEVPPKVLKPGDLPVEQNRQWRPQIGMTRRPQRAHLGGAGHRMVNHYNSTFHAHNRSLDDSRSAGPHGFQAVPPPSSHRRYDNYSGGGSQYQDYSDRSRQNFPYSRTGYFSQNQQHGNSYGSGQSDNRGRGNFNNHRRGQGDQTWHQQNPRYQPYSRRY